MSGSSVKAGGQYREPLTVAKRRGTATQEGLQGQIAKRTCLQAEEGFAIGGGSVLVRTIVTIHVGCSDMGSLPNGWVQTHTCALELGVETYSFMVTQSHHDHNTHTGKRYIRLVKLGSLANLAQGKSRCLDFGTILSDTT
ncbi:hypothetical protein VOLCADRAFT_119908 [Volvox carteri f. nagariensis]|uniref:MTF0821 n=1 Tax=Volvox carteri f. nagariensis TaxID=3068 RepID=D8UHZ1_VOLCA|nr:uncharacterized protein VOLCADRAFT_119908 [Volvox carteri f. nagariensis]ADI46840.1 MTF0821 [Volvox carteri f. nagariensis]EFJ40646.1 hypothetical protein VOLCADRAFT_119908 [Volvox carteri f. nagariensis]|eukprot:XP_002958272.1 hypothetical protein VOLCADRAFT_119908 [Volvox carteri f. nagariensis]